MRGTRSPAAGALLLSAALTLAGCGTTVPLSRTVDGTQQSTGLDGGTTTGTLTGGPQLEPGTGSPAGAGPVAAGGTTTGDTTGSTTGTGASGSVPAVGAGAPTATARGVTAKTITIGVAIATGTEAAASALGISGASAVSERDVWNAVIADVNRSGGILGRKVVLYVHAVDLGTYVANPERTYSEVCSDLKDDHKVFAAFITISAKPLRDCLAKMGTPLVVYGANVSSIVPTAAFSAHGGNYLYAPGGITTERLAQLMVESLVARDFHEKWDVTTGRPGIAPVKLGLIHADTPDQKLLYDRHAAELAKHGLRFSDRFTYSGSASNALAATQAAVLKFSSEGITHVYGASAFFLRYAESQHYRPRYAFLPGLGSFGAANSPPEQLAGAQTVGWAPTQDVNDSEDPGRTAGAARCDAAMRAVGVTGSNRQDRKVMYGICDAAYSFRDALTAGRQPSVSGLRRGYESLGSRFGTALTFSLLLGPNRHYGVSTVRDMAFDSACKCLKYTSRTDRS